MHMKLFDLEYEPKRNLLPLDGTVNYFGKILNQEQADCYYQSLRKGIQWEHDEAMMFGKKLITKRKVAWYANEAFSYTYSKITKQATPWTQELLELKNIIEETTKEQYNSCLCNLYHTGEEGMGWHSDGEKDLKKNGAIASVTLGAERKFAFKHKESKQKVEIYLEHGSLLVMKDETQTHWLHRLPPTKKINTPRINLTFRSIVKNS